MTTTALFIFAAFTFLSKRWELMSMSKILQQLHTDLHDLQMSHGESKNKLFEAYEAVERMERKAELMEKKSRDLQKELDLREQSTVEPKAESMAESTQNLDIVDMKRANEVMVKQVYALEKHIQQQSKREVIERYGPGPHFVRFEVVFMNQLENFRITNYAGSSWEQHGIQKSNFTLELASLDIMPHSVNLFLDMIDQKLWDETVFVHNAEHVLEASPTTFYNGQSKRHLFKEKGTSNVVFQEYSDRYPHLKYTVGFAGRPGGPDFYISTQDNAKFHAPGGQKRLHLLEGGEPCFGRVVDGFSVVDKMIRDSNEEDPTKKKEVLITVIASARLI